MIDALLAEASIGEVWGALRLANGLPYDAYDVLKAPFEFT
jgi:methylmalonyl-CoA mutase N-terminal domain/subunit